MKVPHRVFIGALAILASSACSPRIEAIAEPQAAVDQSDQSWLSPGDAEPVVKAGHDLPVAAEDAASLPGLAVEEVAEPTRPDLDEVRRCERITVSAVYFDSGLSSLSAEAQEVLPGDLRKAIHPGALLDIVGHTDDVGSSEWNYELSDQRAETIRVLLLRIGIGSQQILSVAGLGESEPIGPNETAEGREANRRVEIFSCREVKS